VEKPLKVKKIKKKTTIDPIGLTIGIILTAIGITAVLAPFRTTSTPSLLWGLLMFISGLANLIMGLIFILFSLEEEELTYYVIEKGEDREDRQ